MQSSVKNWDNIFISKGCGIATRRMGECETMERKRYGLVPIGEAFSDLGQPLKAIRRATPQALQHFTRFDQVDLLVGAGEATLTEASWHG